MVRLGKFLFDRNLKVRHPFCRIRAVHVGRKFSIYNGKTFTPIAVTEQMIGHCFGEFMFTKRLGKNIHFNKKKRKGKKK